MALGWPVGEALKAAETLEKEGLSVTVVNARFAKPLDEALLQWFRRGKTVITLEDHCISGGFGSAVLEMATEKAREENNDLFLDSIGRTVVLGAGDVYLPAAKRSKQLFWMKITADQIVETVKTLNISPKRSIGKSEVKESVVSGRRRETETAAAG